MSESYFSKLPFASVEVAENVEFLAEEAAQQRKRFSHKNSKRSRRPKQQESGRRGWRVTAQVFSDCDE